MHPRKKSRYIPRAAHHRDESVLRTVYPIEPNDPPRWAIDRMAELRRAMLCILILWLSAIAVSVLMVRGGFAS